MAADEACRTSNQNRLSRHAAQPTTGARIAKAAKREDQGRQGIWGGAIVGNWRAEWPIHRPCCKRNPRKPVMSSRDLVVELKAVEALAPVHIGQVLAYLRAVKQPLGLLINF